MSEFKKQRVAVLYGGRSGEHEVSLRSAAAVIRNLDRQRFDVVPIAIDKQGHWILNPIEQIEKFPDVLPIHAGHATKSDEVYLAPNPMNKGLMHLSGGSLSNSATPFDVVFPVMHGPLCEDGTIQGLLELADVAYVGCGVLASAVGMDKEVAKRLVQGVGIEIVPYLAYKSPLQDIERASEKTIRELGLPLFVKPANLGSSVGVHKVKQANVLKAAIQDAFKYDTKVIVEKAVDAREIELSVLENLNDPSSPLVSAPGEVIPSHEFYSYESKYIDENGARFEIPARFAPEQIAQAQRMAQAAFKALDCEGMARVDLFLDKSSGKFYFNEVNTIPGFTSISMYPKMWEASGIGYSDLLSRLIDLAVARHRRKAALVREFHSDSET